MKAYDGLSPEHEGGFEARLVLERDGSSAVVRVLSPSGSSIRIGLDEAVQLRDDLADIVLLMRGAAGEGF